MKHGGFMESYVESLREMSDEELRQERHVVANIAQKVTVQVWLIDEEGRRRDAVKALGEVQEVKEKLVGEVTA